MKIKSFDLATRGILEGVRRLLISMICALLAEVMRPNDITYILRYRYSNPKAEGLA